MYKNKPILKNKKNPPSQTMRPVQVYNLFNGMEKYGYIKNYKKYGLHTMVLVAIHYFPLSGLSTIDIDTMSDFKFAEKIAKIL